jgi:hypothetical protein
MNGQTFIAVINLRHKARDGDAAETFRRELDIIVRAGNTLA